MHHSFKVANQVRLGNFSDTSKEKKIAFWRVVGFKKENCFQVFPLGLKFSIFFSALVLH
jgi:hypothetical protein